MDCSVVVVQVHRWYRATVEHEFAYIKRFRILGERYRGKLNCNQRTGLTHLHNALAVIVNLCAYHNRCEQHRVHPPIPQLTDTALLSHRARAMESESDSESESEYGSESDGEVGDANAMEDGGARGARSVLVARGRGVSVSSGGEEAEPPRKRARRQPVASPPLATHTTDDPHRSRADYGQYNYVWEEGAGTGYNDEQFKRQQPVWMWSWVMSDWVAAVVTQQRKGGGVYVRMLYSDEREGVAAGVLRPRVEEQDKE